LTLVQFTFTLNSFILLSSAECIHLLDSAPSIRPHQPTEERFAVAAAFASTGSCPVGVLQFCSLTVVLTLLQFGLAHPMPLSSASDGEAPRCIPPTVGRYQFQALCTRWKVRVSFSRYKNLPDVEWASLGGFCDALLSFRLCYLNWPCLQGKEGVSVLKCFASIVVSLKDPNRPEGSGQSRQIVPVGYFSTRRFPSWVELTHLQCLLVKNTSAWNCAVGALCEIWLSRRTRREVGILKSYYLHWVAAFAIIAVYLGVLYGLYVLDCQFFVPGEAYSDLPLDAHAYMV
ncbi:unnamed protein product, partial [Linum tenue]